MRDLRAWCRVLTILLAAWSWGTPARAQVGDFLSKSSGKADTFGGALKDGGDKDGLSSFSGSFTFPVFGKFSVQIDGLLGGSND